MDTAAVVQGWVGAGLGHRLPLKWWAVTAAAALYVLVMQQPLLQRSAGGGASSAGRAVTQLDGAAPARAGGVKVCRVLIDRAVVRPVAARHQQHTRPTAVDQHSTPQTLLAVLRLLARSILYFRLRQVRDAAVCAAPHIRTVLAASPASLSLCAPRIPSALLLTGAKYQYNAILRISVLPASAPQEGRQQGQTGRKI
jgi:hypothetical protein